MHRSRLLTEAGFLHAVSNASFGNLSYAWDIDGAASSNREQFLNASGTPKDRVIVMSLTHEDAIIEVTGRDCGAGIEKDASYPLQDADGCISRDPSCVLFLLTADCLPVSIVDPITGMFGLFHCGWRSVDRLLPEKAVERFVTHGSDSKNLLVHFGPGILPSSYTFSPEEIAQAKDRHSAGWQPHVKQLPSGRVAIDIPGYVHAQLMKAGVAKENIEMSGIDTATDVQYFSHYRSVRTGEPEQRFATILRRISEN